MTNLTNDELLKTLRSTRSEAKLKEYTEQLEKLPSYGSFSEYLKAFMLESQLSESDLIKASGIQRTYAYQIFNGNKNPGREKGLEFAHHRKSSPLLYYKNRLKFIKYYFFQQWKHSVPFHF